MFVIDVVAKKKNPMTNNTKVKYIKETFNLPFGEGYGTSVQEVK